MQASGQDWIALTVGTDLSDIHLPPDAASALGLDQPATTDNPLGGSSDEWSSLSQPPKLFPTAQELRLPGSPTQYGACCGGTSEAALCHDAELPPNSADQLGYQYAKSGGVAYAQYSQWWWEFKDASAAAAEFQRVGPSFLSCREDQRGHPVTTQSSFIGGFPAVVADIHVSGDNARLAAVQVDRVFVVITDDIANQSYEPGEIDAHIAAAVQHVAAAQH